MTTHFLGLFQRIETDNTKWNKGLMVVFMSPEPPIKHSLPIFLTPSWRANGRRQSSPSAYICHCNKSQIIIPRLETIVNDSLINVRKHCCMLHFGVRKLFPMYKIHTIRYRSCSVQNAIQVGGLCSLVGFYLQEFWQQKSQFALGSNALSIYIFAWNNVMTKRCSMEVRATTSNSWRELTVKFKFNIS